MNISPNLSTRFFPNIYRKLNGKAKIDWDVHIISLTQCTIIVPVAVFALAFDQERKNMTWQERVWGYTGVTNTLLRIANGYFVRHLLSMIKTLRSTVSSWLHMVCALLPSCYRDS
jgi:TLC domain